jgi:acetyl-CoA acetyltransferase
VTDYLTMLLLFFSYMAATMFAAQSIQLGINDIVVAGGMESMSNDTQSWIAKHSVKLYVF